jgi:hypothetical protein
VGQRRHRKSRGLYFFVWEKRIENHQLGTGCFVQQRIVPVGTRAEFVSDRMSCIVLRGR